MKLNSSKNIEDFKNIKNIAVLKELDILTNPDKILFTKLKTSKIMLADFYISIKDWILPHIINRPLTILRCPSGIKAPCFFQKHPGEKVPKYISYVEVSSKVEERPYLFIKDLAGLLSLVQLGATEIHIWNCQVTELARPDQLIIDLDPDKDFTFSQITQAALIINKFFQKIKLVNFLKTTGRKALNIVIPLSQKNDSEEVLLFARKFSEFMGQLFPDRFVSTMSKTKRKGKIFIDYLRNAPSATFIAPYSTRANESIGISTPLSWKELNSITSGDHYNFTNLLLRLEKIKDNPWNDFYKIKQSIKKEHWKFFN